MMIIMTIPTLVSFPSATLYSDLSKSIKYNEHHYSLCVAFRWFHISLQKMRKTTWEIILVGELGKTSPKKECLLSGIAQIRGGEAPARHFLPSFHKIIGPKIGKFLLKSHNTCMFFVVVIFVINFINIIIITIIIIISTIIIIICTFFCHTRKTSFMTSEERGPSCPNWGEGGAGGGLIWATPKSKHSFFGEVFP